MHSSGEMKNHVEPMQLHCAQLENGCHFQLLHSCSVKKLKKF